RDGPVDRVPRGPAVLDHEGGDLVPDALCGDGLALVEGVGRAVGPDELRAGLMERARPAHLLPEDAERSMPLRLAVAQRVGDGFVRAADLPGAALVVDDHERDRPA